MEILRGPEGGIRLKVDPKDVSMYDLLVAIDKNRVINACMQPDFKCAWREKNGASCMVHKQLLNVQRMLDEEFRKRSLYEMLFGDQGKGE